MINNVKKEIEELFDKYKKRLQPRGEQINESSQVRQITEVDELGLEKKRGNFFCLSLKGIRKRLIENKTKQNWIDF